jgi:hypothetical protein
LEAIADAALLVVAAVCTTEPVAHHATVRPFTHSVMFMRHGKMPVLHHEAGDGDEAMFLTIIEALIERTRCLGQVLQCCTKLRDRIGPALQSINKTLIARRCGGIPIGGEPLRAQLGKVAIGLFERRPISCPDRA